MSTLISHSALPRFIFAMLLLFSLTGFGLSCKYASFTPQHTMCKSASSTCNIKSRGLTHEDKNLIVHLHNDLRRKVANGTETRQKQPSASNMAVLRWDDELAQLAQKHAENCRFQHDCAKCREVARFPVGQNLYLRSSSQETDKVTWDTAILGWYNEVAKFPARTVDSFAMIPGTLHYSQMIWAETNQIGCGFAHFKDKKMWRKLFVCNYGPTGNWLEEAVYAKGKPCSACTPGKKCSTKYSGLCD